MTLKTVIINYHSLTPGAVPPSLEAGQIGLNVADQIEFVGYGGDINFDVNGDAIPDPLPPVGKGWKAYYIGGGAPGPAGQGVPAGGTTGQILAKLTDGDYVTAWVDNYGPASSTELGVVYATTPNLFGNANVSLGYGAHSNIGSGVNNVAIGTQAGLNQNDTSDNVVIGYQAALNIDGSRNVSIGSLAFGNNPGGFAQGNTGVGYKSGYNLTEGDFNTFLGYQSGLGVRTGNWNTFVGNYSGDNLMSGNVVLADGIGNVRFQANAQGAWSPDGVNYGSADYVLVSRGPNLPPEWRLPPTPNAVNRIIAGTNITISPPSGTGDVTINAAGGGGGGISSIRAGEGLLVANGGSNPITTSGELRVDYSKVLATAYYAQPGSIVYAESAGVPITLALGTPGQLLQAQADGSVAWATVPSASPATPLTYGLVYGSTTSGSLNVTLGLGSGSAITSGTNNTLIGPGAGGSITTGDGNVILGAGDGDSGMNNNILISDGSGTSRLQINEDGAWAVNGEYGLPGQVLSSTGMGSQTEWVTPVNAPIQTVSDGPGISTQLIGTDLQISNEGVLSVSANAPIQAVTTNGNVVISAPSILSDLTAGAGIAIAGTGNARTISNSGVISLQNGTNTSVVNVGNGVWQVNATGGASGITSLLQGDGITITNPSGPSPTITNSGILNVVSDTPGTIGVTVTNGIAHLSVAGGSGVTKLIAGSNISLSPTSGVGEVTISAAGGGGGGNITQITSAPNSGISVTSGTGPIVSLANTGILNVTAGTGIRVDPDGPGVVKITNTQPTSAVLSVSGQGAGISVSPTTGAVVVQNTGVTSIAGTTGNITATSSSGAVTLNIGSNVLTNILPGNSGISIGGTGNSRTISAAVAGLAAGTGINLTSNNNVYTITNTGVTGLTAGTNVSIVETTPGSGNFTISSTGGGGGSGTVTKIETGYGLSGGPITTTGTLQVADGVFLAYDQFPNKGAMIYKDATGFAYTGKPSAYSGPSDTYRQVLSAYEIGAGVFVDWHWPAVGGFKDSDSITYHGIIDPFGPNQFYFDVETGWLQDYLGRTVAGNDTGAILYVASKGGAISKAQLGGIAPGSPGQVLTMAGGIPAWQTPSAGVTSVGATNPVTISGTPSNPIVGFDVNTNLLTKYIPNSSFTLSGQLLYGTGAGTYSALNIGNNGQVLTVGSSGQLTWADIPIPPPVNLTPADNSITLNPNPITGAGTIGVTPGKFVESSLYSVRGVIAFGGTDGKPARLDPPNDAIKNFAFLSWNADAAYPKWGFLDGAQSEGNACSFGPGASYYWTSGNTCIGKNATPTSTATNSGEVVISSGTGKKIHANGSGAMSFGPTDDYGLSGAVLTSQGTNEPPKWVKSSSQFSSGSVVAEESDGATLSQFCFNLTGAFMTVQLFIRRIPYTSGSSYPPVETHAWNISYYKEKGSSTWVQKGLQDLITGELNPNLNQLGQIAPYVYQGNQVYVLIPSTGSPGYKTLISWNINSNIANAPFL